MKIGVITVHRAYNYGSVLQCYALQEYLKNLGHDVQIIDYRQRWTEAVYKVFSLYYVWYFIRQCDYRAVIDYVRKYKMRHANIKRQKEVFGDFQKEYNLTKQCRWRMPSGFDVYFIGSDQLWTHHCVGGEDSFYLGDFCRASNSKVIGYSISTSLYSLQKFGEKKLKKILNNFDCLSFREKSNAVVVEQMTGFKIPVTVDPTILVGSELWNTMINEEWSDRNYIAIYQARPVVGNENYLKEKALELSQKMNCDVVDLRLMEYSVRDFISIIKYAKCILTTSYHAVVFSVLFETPCYAIKLNDGLDVRYVDLLKELGLEEELVETDFTPVPLCVNFDGVRARIKEYIKPSVEYINKI